MFTLTLYSFRPRFRHRLDAPPALLKKSDETAVTYLNKGAQYSLLVEDTSPLTSDPDNMLYCTSIQIAFDSEPQRRCPAALWRLWDQSRGADEGHLFDERFLAIEYVTSELVYSDKSDDRNHISNVQAVHSDGFSLVWGTNRHGSRECSITIQLNFLSTDFSHAKGVHGVTMQLCSKTEEISTDSLRFPSTDPRISYCRIHLFRSHGAERKMANDIASTEKQIKRLEK